MKLITLSFKDTLKGAVDTFNCALGENNGSKEIRAAVLLGMRLGTNLNLRA